MTAKKLKDHQVKCVDLTISSTRGVLCLPTGTGKTLIQANSIATHIDQNDSSDVYVVFAPRILLANQLFSEIKKYLETSGKDVQYLVVHSGRKLDDDEFDDEDSEIVELKTRFRGEIKSTTSPNVVREEYERAQRENVPLIIVSTYHSAERIIQSDIPIYACYADEAHNLVSQQFNFITTDIKTEKFFSFTATMKVTDSETGLGMQNVQRFGEVLFKMTPLEAILLGLIVRPRMHLVRTAGVDDTNNELADTKVVEDAYHEHRSLLENINPKLLVICKGSEHLNGILQRSKFFAKMRSKKKNLHVFDITSKYGPRHNGEVIDRNEWLVRVQTLGADHNAEMIIMHIDILSEGIDVPGITGILPFNNLGKSKFVQTLGRASRLHIDDRERINDGELKPDDLSSFIKPAAWVILPEYGHYGEDLTTSMKDMILELRSYGFNPSEHIFVKEDKGAPLPKMLDQLNEKNKKLLSSLIEWVNVVQHEIESTEEYERIVEEKNTIDNSAEMLDF